MICRKFKPIYKKLKLILWFQPIKPHKNSFNFKHLKSNYIIYFNKTEINEQSKRAVMNTHWATITFNMATNVNNDFVRNIL